MSNNPPNPWGSCFDAAAHNLVANMQENVRMCHAVGVANKPGEEGTAIAHAWIEFDHNGDRIALDCIWLTFQLAEVYRRNLQASYVVTYSKDEFMDMWFKEGFPGPWDETIKQFTSDNISAKAA